MRPRPRVISHSRLGLYGACPAAFKQCEGAPDIPGPAAERGGQMHEALWKPEAFMKLSEIDKGAVEWCKRVRDELCNKFLGVPFYGNEGERHIEVYFDPIAIPGVEEKFWPDGTADAVKLHGKAGYIDDFKTGKAEFDEDFAIVQGCGYALSMFDRWEHLEAVYVAIIHAGSLQVFRYTLKREHVPALLAQLYRKIQDCLSDNPKYNPGVGTCTRCPGAATCPAANNALTVLHQSGDIMERIGQMGPEERRDWYEKAKVGAKVADGIIKAIKDYATKNPGTMEGYELRTSSRRRITASKEMVLQTLYKYGVPKALADTAFRSSLSALESVYREAKRDEGMTSEEVSAEFAAVMEPLCEKAEVTSLRRCKKE